MAHLNPIPNGYGIVKLPHFRGHPGLVVLIAVSIFFLCENLVVLVAVSIFFCEDLALQLIIVVEIMNSRIHNLIHRNLIFV